MLSLILLATMIALSVIYFSDVGFRMLLVFWAAYFLGYGLLFLPFEAAGFIVLGYHTLVVAGLFMTAKTNA